MLAHLLPSVPFASTLDLVNVGFAVFMQLFIAPLGTFQVLRMRLLGALGLLGHMLA